jgi:hypothetical protein
MRLTVVGDGQKIRHANQALRAALKACGGRSVPTNVGFQGETHHKNVLWSDTLGIWTLAWVFEGNRYWNDLGLKTPHSRGPSVLRVKSTSL